MKFLNSLLLITLIISLFNSAYAQNHTKHAVTYKEITGISDGGFRYTLFQNGNSQIAKVNEIVYFDLIIRHEDSIIQDSRGYQQRELLIPENTLYNEPNPVIDALTLMAANDSMVIYERIDTIKNLPTSMKGWKEISYSILMRKILTEKDIRHIQDMKPMAENMLKADILSYNSGKLAGIKKTSSGIRYIIHSEGKGSQVKAGEKVQVYYYGATVKDSREFDNSYKKGSPFTFLVGVKQVIPGWDEALLLFKRGSKVTIFILGNLAYGEQGVLDMIPPNSELAFYIEILE